ncbi:MAG TPA: DUF4398 domain-containing protein [Vicinamibacterales bacterium]|nr:DUF4398 domain-containing protein [Vicinamibacterales bacterium]
MLARCFTILVVALLTLSCSAPPEKEHQLALQALLAARTADTTDYAPEELAAAETALASYDRAVADRDYRQALSRALEAREKANLAPLVAGERKAQTRVQADSLLAECNAVLSSLRTRMTATGARRPTSAQLTRLREATLTTPSQIRVAEALINQQNYKNAIAALTPILQSLRQDEVATSPRSGR